jgi:Beta-galactosidase/Carbohydrate binding domain
MQTVRDPATSNRCTRPHCVVLLLLFLAGPARPVLSDEPPRTAGKVTLGRVTVAPLQVNRNLLTNASFETTPPRGTIPEGWIWERRNTDATCLAVPGVAHGGRQSIRFTNGTPFGAHVYGTFWSARPVRLDAGRPYTMSAWVKSDDPGIVSLVGGSAWQFRVQARATGGRWERIAATFTPAGNDGDFTFRINTESPTQSVWIDDVKLEQGSEPTPDPPSGSAAATALLVPDRAAIVIQGDGPFHASFTSWTPRALSGNAEVSLSTGETLSAPVSLAAGFRRLVIEGQSTAALDAPRTLTLRLLDGSRELARASGEIRFHSAASVLARLDVLARELSGLQEDLAAVRARGQDPSYPQVTATVIAYFLPLVRQDVQHRTVTRALREVGELETLAARLRGDLAKALAGGLVFPPVPRWTAAERPSVRGSSFLAAVRWPDGTQAKRPVFFTGYGHFARVVSDMEKWPALGANIIQIELGPSRVFPKEGMTDDAPAQEMRHILDRARKSGVAVCLLISPHYLPDWALARWPRLRKHRTGFLQYCLHAPEGQELLRQFVTSALGPIKDHPALHSICLSNEPVNQEEPCEPARDAWHDWLRKRHGDLARLNRLHGTSYGSFADVPLPDPFGSRPALPLWIDYIRFNQESFAAWHAMLADAVHRVAPGLPVHAKAMTWTFLNDGDVGLGVDATLFGGFSDINGNDAVNFAGSGLDAFAQGWQANAMGHDLQRSTRDAPVFNTENHIIEDRTTRDVPPAHVRAALWQAAVHGQSATTIWVWERTYDARSDFAGSILERPACAEAVGLVGHDLNRAAVEVTALQQARPRALLLHSTSSLVCDTGRHGECRTQLYTALVFSGLTVGFITERQLEAGTVPDVPVVFVPDVVHLSDAAAATLAKYPGRLVLVGADDALTRDDHDRPATRTLAAERLPWRYGRNTWRDLWNALPARLSAWSVLPPVALRDSHGAPVWGVDWRIATTPNDLIINLCNERNDAVTVSIARGQEVVPLNDVLTGEPVGAAFTLKPLEVRLLRQGRR